MEARPRTRGRGEASADTCPVRTATLARGGRTTHAQAARARSFPTAAPANPRFALNGRGLGTTIAAAAAGPEVTSSTGRPFGALDRVSLGV